jgi:hypothetical protein
VAVLALERIDVSPDRIDALVRVVDPGLGRTSAVPGLAARAFALLPGLARHTCENGTAHGIAAELADTELPHLFEHVTVECMALAGSPRSLRAETAWDFARDGRGVYHVRLGYDDDLVALASLKSAARIVDWLVGRTGEQPDVGAIVAEIRAVRAPER